MRRIYLLVLYLIPAIAYSQEYITVCYDADRKVVAESAGDYCIIGKSKIDSYGDTVLAYTDTVAAYYVKERSRKFVRLYDKGLQHGPYEEYYTSGKIKEKGAYVEGFKNGLISYYYPDGKNHYTATHTSDFDRGIEVGYTVETYYDSTGNQLVKDGKGQCKCTFDDESGLLLQGEVKFGNRNGIWTGFRNDTLQFRENYEGGKLRSGESYEGGRVFRYTKLQAMPEFTGGYEAMYVFIRKNLRYPASARRHGVSGTVYIQFEVEKDGRILNARVIRGAQADIDAEALRVVQLMPDWKPAERRGRVVSERFVLPIKFKLN